MEIISSKDIFLLMKDVLSLANPGPAEHGFRVAYILYRMLQCRGGFEPFELADIAIFTTFHDIGVYTTDPGGDILEYDTRDYVPHCASGFLIYKYLAPRPEWAPIYLYHHTDYNRLSGLSVYDREMTSMLHIADRADIYHKKIGTHFDFHIFDSLRGKKMWDRGLDFFFLAEQQFSLMRKLENGLFRRELDELLDYTIFSNEEKEKYLRALVCFVGIRSQSAVVDAVTCNCVCRAMADRLFLSEEDKNLLRLASYLHDVGMTAIPKEILEAPRKLTEEERRLLRTHVTQAEAFLKGRVPREVVEIVLAHHERGDGSGYPRMLKDRELTQLQRILQVADTFTALINDRSYRPGKNKREVIDILKEEQRRGRFNKQLVDLLVNYFDDIYTESKTQAELVLDEYSKLLRDYEKLSKTFHRNERAD